MRTRAFTLIEVLLAVGAAAIIAVGIAAVFAAAGDVITGGRRVSHFSRYAAQIESQMRADVASMTRDGYLLIRNEEAFDGNDIGVFVDELPNLRRPRRIDELMFFSRGTFTTAREALIPGYVASADAARIYYGHGMPINPNVDDVLYYAEPEPSDDPGNNGTNQFDALSIFGDDSVPGNPIAYASDWILMRHVLLLSEAGGAAVDVPANPPYGMFPIQLADSDVQIALQPAASHLFRALMGIIPDQAVVVAVRPGQWPRVSSGLVDIATTSLSEIKSIIVAMQNATQEPQYPFDIQSEADFDAIPLQWSPFPLDIGDMDDQDRLDAMHQWMLEGLPSLSHIENSNQRSRMRCEPVSPNYVGMISDDGLAPAERVYRPADQLMLVGSTFVPHCTEFIVEWSYGEVYPMNHPTPALRGRTVWHGLERHVDLDGDGNDLDDPPVAIPYDTLRTDFLDFAHSVPYRLDGGSQQFFDSYPVGGYAGGTGGIGDGAANGNQSWLIHGLDYLNDMEDEHQLMSYFGYHDPTFNPNDPNRNGNFNDAALAESIPWAWPTMMRVTISLADPNNPSIEETFQFVIDMPGDPEP